MRRRAGIVQIAATLAGVVAAAGCAGPRAPSLACPAGAEARASARDGWCELPDGVRHGPVWSRHANGRLATAGTVEHGRLQGPWQEWHPNGRPSITAEFRDDVLCGDFTVWSDAGTRLFAGRHDERGAMDGPWRKWWPDGALRMEWNMRHGRHDGPVRGWHETGALRLEGAYTDGRPSGRWTWWRADGSVQRSCERDPAADPIGRDACAPATDVTF